MQNNHRTFWAIIGTPIAGSATYALMSNLLRRGRGVDLPVEYAYKWSNIDATNEVIIYLLLLILGSAIYFTLSAMKMLNLKNIMCSYLTIACCIAFVSAVIFHFPMFMIPFTLAIPTLYGLLFCLIIGKIEIADK